MKSRYFIPQFVSCIVASFLCGCSSKTEEPAKKVEEPKKSEAAAELHVVSYGRKPVIVATARIPLDASSSLRYFMAIDGNSIYGDRVNYLPIKPRSSEIRFGIVTQDVPFSVLGEKLNEEAMEATIKEDTTTLQRIAKSLSGRISFFYETREEAYGIDGP